MMNKTGFEVIAIKLENLQTNLPVEKMDQSSMLAHTSKAPPRVWGAVLRSALDMFNTLRVF